MKLDYFRDMIFLIKSVWKIIMNETHYITRHYDDLEDYCQPNKVLIIFGSRQAGKTTLLQAYLKKCPYRYRLDSGGNIFIQNLFASADFKIIREYVSGYELIAIDEAQMIPNIGQILKIIVDQVPHIRVIATGSSSFELAGQVGEPLTGRKITLILYPVSQFELLKQFDAVTLKRSLEDYLIYGSYPEIISASTQQEKRERLIEITQSYLLKDILAFNKIKNAKALLDLLRLLVFQVGNEVSHSELAQKIGVDTKTIARYLDLLEKTFVIYCLRGFSRNLRNEVTKKNKYYFYDNGIRNALIANFNALSLRNDVGSLWENFLIIERIKKQSYLSLYANNYFWRTWEQQEIDFIEEREGKLYGYEFKWGDYSVKSPKIWLSTYENASFTLINQQNYLEFVT